MKLQILAAALSIGASSYAMAADPGLPMEQPPLGFNWTGGYAGVQIGYAWGDAPYYSEDYRWGYDYDPDGFFGGLYAGYNHQLPNNLVVGIDADINVSGLDSRYEDNSDWAGHVASSEVKYTGALRARLGYAADRWLPYIAGGVSVAKYEFDLDHDGSGNWDFRDKKSFTGWNIGAGVEYAATDNIIVRGEYRYTDFGDWRNFDNEWGWGNSVELKTHDVRLGVAYKF